MYLCNMNLNIQVMKKFTLWSILLLILVGLSGLTICFVVKLKDIPLSLMAIDIICLIGIAVMFKERK